MRAVLVNGEKPQNTAMAIGAADRGLNYGDGLFETMSLSHGRVRHLSAHLERLQLGCSRLGIEFPEIQRLQDEIAAISSGSREGIIKIVLTRGTGGRGYRPHPELIPTRIITLHDPPANCADLIKVRWCEMRLARSPALAGIKHLNRLEQVLAQQEWADPTIEEGLMLDYEGELVCGTASNVFIVRSGEVITPDLRYCGVRGVMRAAVIAAAARLELPVREEPLWPHDLNTANEVFVTNAVRGVRAVVALDEMTWPHGPITEALQRAAQSDA